MAALHWNKESELRGLFAVSRSPCSAHQCCVITCAMCACVNGCRILWIRDLSPITFFADRQTYSLSGCDTDIQYTEKSAGPERFIGLEDSQCPGKVDILFLRGNSFKVIHFTRVLEQWIFAYSGFHRKVLLPKGKILFKKKSMTHIIQQQ